jgi:phage virion morphogenesis protein
MNEALNFEIDVSQALGAVEHLESKGKSIHQLTNVLGTVMLDDVMENFEQEGRPEKWVPLKASTLKERAKKDYNGPILQRTGDLKRSITKNVTSSNEVQIGTNKEYAAIQHFGGQAGRNRSTTIPSRQFLILTQQDLDELVQVTIDYLGD